MIYVNGYYRWATDANPKEYYDLFPIGDITSNTDIRFALDNDNIYIISAVDDQILVTLERCRWGFDHSCKAVSLVTKYRENLCGARVPSFRGMRFKRVDIISTYSCGLYTEDIMCLTIWNEIPLKLMYHLKSNNPNDIVSPYMIIRKTKNGNYEFIDLGTGYAFAKTTKKTPASVKLTKNCKKVKIQIDDWKTTKAVVEEPERMEILYLNSPTRVRGYIPDDKPEVYQI